MKRSNLSITICVLAGMLLIGLVGNSVKKNSDRKETVSEQNSTKTVEQETETVRELPSKEELATGIPYEGMPEEYLSDTSLGEAVYQGSNTKPSGGKIIYTKIYRYYDGNAVIFVAKVKEGVVSEVLDIRDHPWVPEDQSGKSEKETSEGSDSDDPSAVADETNSSNQQGNASEKNQKEYDFSDPYDVDWYDDADDFASDWEDEFDDYEDAYDYWEEYYDE